MNNNVITINENIRKLLPITYNILTEANLTVHPSVYKVILSGSRGIANCFRQNSDIDLSLLVDMQTIDGKAAREDIFKEVLDVTTSNWRSEIELDTVAVFDTCNCRLQCFNYETYTNEICKTGGVDCLGLYKTNKGFSGFVPKIGIEIRLIHPTITVWERSVP